MPEKFEKKRSLSLFVFNLWPLFSLIVFVELPILSRNFPMDVADEENSSHSRAILWRTF